MRPQREFVTGSIADDASWRLQTRNQAEVPFEWHYHPEYELTLTLNARGQRFVGDSSATLGESDLVLVGANLPHAWSVHGSRNEAEPQYLRVCWFSREWLENLLRACPELSPVGRLCARAAYGVEFSVVTAERLREKILAFEGMSATRRLPALLDVLVQLAEAEDARALASGHYSGWVRTNPRNERLARVLAYLHEHFAEEVDLEDLAARAALSVGAFHRFFRRHLQMTVTQYVAHLRIGQACQWLIESEKPIKVIASEVGYMNLAHFNRQFRAIRNTTPRAFRAQFRPPR